MFEHPVVELFYIPMWNILKMWATYSKALLENHMIFHLCVVAFHQFLVSSRECARTSKVVAVAPLLRNNWTKSYAQNLRRSHARRLGVVQLLFLFILKIWKFENHGCFQLELLVFCQLWLHLGLPWNGFDSHSYCDFVVCLDESRQVNIARRNSWNFVYNFTKMLKITHIHLHFFTHIDLTFCSHQLKYLPNW